MPDIDLSKLSPALREQLERELAPKPERADSVGVSFTYDPDDLESVKRGVKRGHLTREEALAWGHPEDAFPESSGGGGDEGGDGGGDGGGGEPPKRRGYFEKG